MPVWPDRKSHRIVAQSLLTTVTDPRPWWHGYLTSAVVHTAAVALMLAIFVPAAREIKHRKDVILLAPPLPSYQTKAVPSPRIVPRPAITKDYPVIPRRVPLPVLKPPEIVLARELPPKDLPSVEAVHPAPAPKVEVSPPKPAIHTGIFENSALATGPQVQKQLKVGGFGDPHGVPPSTNPQHSALALAGVGSFDLPAGEGSGGSGGHSRSGVRQTSFDGLGNTTKGPPGTEGHSGSVRTGAFGDSAAIASTQTESAKPVQPLTTPVEILYKPKPAYSEEARKLKLEGQVSLEVTFLASGSVHIIRVLRGLGHGLDEAAQAAASQVRFRPATRAGVPIDTSGTIYITFELA